MQTDEILQGLEGAARFFAARFDMAVGEGKMLLASWEMACREAARHIESERIVLCQDCIHFNDHAIRVHGAREGECKHNGLVVEPAWYCVDGVKRGGGADDAAKGD